MSTIIDWCVPEIKALSDNVGIRCAFCEVKQKVAVERVRERSMAKEA
jgi:hypothetical protein